MNKIQLWKKICAYVLIVALVFGLCPDIARGEETNIEGEQETINNDEEMIDDEPTIKEEEATILCELTSKRTEKEKRFLMSDMTQKVAVYSEPVHYKKNGKWEDIDNSLKEYEAEGENDFKGYINKSNDFSAKISSEDNDDMQVEIEKDKYSLGFKLLSSKKDFKVKKVKKENKDNSKKNKELEVKTNSETVLYNDILDDTNIEYMVTSTGIKENIIVNKIQNKYDYVYEMEAKNLDLELKNNEIIAKDKETEEVVYTIPKPFMYDANQEVSKNVKYSLKKKKDVYLLEIKADKKWINDENRQFPVTIDPVITTATTKAAIASTFVTSNYPTTNYNEYLMLMVGRESSSYGKCRTFVKFSLPELNNGDIIVSAKLNLLQYQVNAYTTSTPDLPIEAYMITSSWNESSITWNTMPSVNSKALDYSYMCKDDGEEFKIYDITKAAKSWYDADVANYGIMLKSGKESGTLVDSGINGRYWSEKYNSQTNAYPYIELEYRNTKGIEDYYSYTDLDAGEAGNAAINNYTGNLVFTQEGVATSGEKAPASVYLVNNSADSNKYNYGSKPYCGYGWKLNIQQTVKSSSSYGLSGTALSTYPYVYMDEDGTEHYFMKVVSGSTTKYYDEDGLGLELTVSSSGYTIKDSQDGKMTFLSNGNLSTIADSNGNTIRINYDSTNTIIQSVTDGAGRSITIQCSGNYLSKLTDPAGRSTSYTISSTKLMTVTNPDATSVSYTYATDNVLTSAKDVDNYKLVFEYLSKAKGRRISKVKEYGYNSSNEAVLGQTIGYNYNEYNVTKITTSGVDNAYGTSDDIVTEYQFDNYGRLISTDSISGGKRFGASKAIYTSGRPNASASNIKSLNRVTKSTSLGGNVNNLVLNHNMEKSTNWEFLKDGTVTDLKGFVTNYSYTGAKSLRLAATETTAGSRLRYRQVFSNTSVVPGKTYTLSAYIKTTSLATVTPDKYGAGLLIICYLPDGTTKGFYSDYISRTTETSINDGWRRETVTFTVPTNATKTSVNLLFREATGNAYFDSVQLEEGNVANKYNILENGSFENSSSMYAYTATNAGTSDGVVSGGVNGSNCYRIAGEKDKKKWIAQEVDVSGKEEDTYIISGWTKADAAPAFIEDGSSDIDRKFKISVKVTYSDGSSVWKSAAESNPDVVGWQYISLITDLSDNDTSTNKTPAKLGIYPRYDYQLNYAYFDNLSVVRDDVQSYTYDNNGNMISVVDNANQKSSMTYSNNNLMSDTDAKGYAYTYTYDSKHNMTQAKSQYGVMYNYTYNSAGNPTKLVVQNMATSSNDMRLQTDMTYTSDGAYTSSVSDQDGNTVTNTYNTDKGLLTSTTNQKGETTSYTYNSNNDLITKVSTTNDEGEEVSNTFGYDKHILNRITHNGFNYNYDYDEFGNESNVKVGNTPLLSKSYNTNNGEISRVTYGNGDYNTYTYDKYGNVASMGINGTTRLKNYADISGNIVRNEDIVNKLQYNYDYDFTGRLIRSSVVDTALAQSASRNKYAVEYGYDLNNNIDKIKNKAGTKTLTYSYEYTKDNLMRKSTMPSLRALTYSYDSLLRRTGYEISTTTPFKVSYVYYLSGRNASGEDTYRTTKLASETLGDKTTKYIYDTLGNITSILEKNTRNI